MADHFVGLMSGTSLDGVDGVLADFSAARPRVIAHAALPFGAALRAELLALNAPGSNELHRAAMAGNALAAFYAQAVQQLLELARLPPSAVRAIGAHGQTVRHQPGVADSHGNPGPGYTLQLNQPALLAELTGIDVVADFRSRDVAAGGQGAPLVPAFHSVVFGEEDEAVCVLNLGGIANLSVLPPRSAAAAGPAVGGFDCGPGNALLDGWCARHTGQPFDAGGAWAASGQVLPALLTALRAHPFFARPAPKSTGRDDFHLPWLDDQLAQQPTAAPQDVQATLTELTATTCADCVRSEGRGSATLVVCGGGTFNELLMRRLQALLPGVAVVSSATRGLPPLQVEAAAFAWLARQMLLRLPGNLPAVTGAAGPRVLGALYPA